MNVTDKINDLKQREEKVLKMGGGKAVEKQHGKGKLTARERLFLLFDDGSFIEMNELAESQSIYFGM